VRLAPHGLVADEDAVRDDPVGGVGLDPDAVAGLVGHPVVAGEPRRGAVRLGGDEHAVGELLPAGRSVGAGHRAGVAPVGDGEQQRFTSRQFLGEPDAQPRAPVRPAGHLGSLDAQAAHLEPVQVDDEVGEVDHGSHRQLGTAFEVVAERLVAQVEGVVLDLVPVVAVAGQVGVGAGHAIGLSPTGRRGCRSTGSCRAPTPRA
jgi:hypothetical protein